MTQILPRTRPLPGAAYPNNIEIASNDLLYTGSQVRYGNHATGEDDLWVYDFNGSLQTSYYLSGYAKNLLARQMVVYGGDRRLVTPTNDPKMIIVMAP